MDFKVFKALKEQMDSKVFKVLKVDKAFRAQMDSKVYRVQ
jgi:hypothetical protein